MRDSQGTIKSRTWSLRLIQIDLLEKTGRNHAEMRIAMQQCQLVNGSRGGDALTHELRSQVPPPWYGTDPHAGSNTQDFMSHMGQQI
jgi:hypothetical protein